jgi:hypothetical protein
MLRRYWVIALWGYSVIGLLGCATVAEVGKGVAGLSTKVLEDARPAALVKSFNYDYPVTYQKAKEFLKAMGCYIYADLPKKNLIAVYLSSEDTTVAGVFFQPKNIDTTQIEVVSASTSVKEYISRRLFALMAGKADPEIKKEGQEKLFGK